MSLADIFQSRSQRKNMSVYQTDDFDSGFPSSSKSSCCGLLENKLKNEVIRSEKRRSALAGSLKNAYYAIEHQKICLEQQEQDATSSKSTLESLLMRQELLESRLSNLKNGNLYPDFLNLFVSEKNVQQSSRYPAEVRDYSRINALEREISNFKEKRRNYCSIWANNTDCTKNVCEAQKVDKAEELEIHEGLKQHAELMEAKCSNAQRESDILELQIVSLHSGLYQAKVTSKEFEKECVKLQSQIAANRNINESLHLEVSALKQHNHTLENTVKGSESENKSLHVQVESLQKEKQILASQKELLFEMIKKKGKWRGSEKLNRRTPEVIPKRDKGSTSPEGGSSVCELSGAASVKHSRRRRRRKDKKWDSNDQKSSQSHDCQADYDRNYILKEKEENSRKKESKNLEESELKVMVEYSSGNDIHRHAGKRSELNTDIIVACYQHLADLLSKLECLKMNNVKLGNEKEEILKFLLRTIKDFQDYKINSESSREEVEKLLNERMDLRENYHKRINQVTAVIIELKHLRQAYNGLLRHTRDSDDKKAMEWISRVQAIKDSLKLLQEQHNLNPILLMKRCQEIKGNK
ncbi:myosin heavy chain, clone 203-like [Ranitomeya imitator]|uniref:myosin heavy chain, clone 203-like n=1 Tax=Ranitomeya imitator TaxID=111125 RepID=UPI0037E7E5BB